MKIGIFGGCFNPPHKMHKDIADSLINNGHLDQVIFVPTGNGYTKAELVDVDKRIDMLRLMIDNDNIAVSDISKDLKYQYTFQVLDYYQSKYIDSSIYFICGTDNLNEFDTWQKYEYILSKYKLLVVKRNDDNIDDLRAKYSKYKEHICIVNLAQNPISSTMVRKYVKEENLDELIKCMDKKVLEYIQQKGLYKN